MKGVCKKGHKWTQINISHVLFCSLETFTFPPSFWHNSRIPYTPYCFGVRDRYFWLGLGIWRQWSVHKPHTAHPYLKKSWVHCTDCDDRCCSHRYRGEIPDFYTAPCNGVVSHGAQFGDLRVFADHKRKTNALTIFVQLLLACDCFHAQPAVYACY